MKCTMMSSLCPTVFTALRQVELTVVLEQLGSTFFDTALLMVVKDRSANATYPDSHLSREDSQQKAISDFYMTFYLIAKLAPIIPALLLAKLSDRGWRRAPIALSLGGYMFTRVALLLVVIFRLPLAVMFAAAVLHELCGGYCALWSSVMTLKSLSTTQEERSKAIMRVELLYGMAGLVGSLLSGHLFLVNTFSLGDGTLLIFMSALLHLLSLLHSIFLLQVKQVPIQEPEEESLLLSSSGRPVEAPPRINKGNVLLLFTAAVLYDSAVVGAVDMLGAFEMKEPLSWTATQVGYANAAGCMIFFTSFIGVVVFRRCMTDVMLILIGMISFATGIYFMSFVTTTYMFYLARSLNLFALIPLPTIRSLVSKQVPASSCGITLTFLQLALRFAGLAYIPAFTKIYQRTLDWFPGFIFTLSSILTVLGMIPISIVGCRLQQIHSKWQQTD